MGLRDILGGNGHREIGHLASQYVMEYVPCGEECRRCHEGHCTKSDGHSSGQGHQSSRGYNKSLQEEGCGHSW